MSLNKLLERNAHFFLNCAWIVDVATNTEELGAGVVLSAERLEPVGSATNYCWDDRNSLHVRHRGGAPVHPCVGWKWRLQPGTTGLAFE